MKYLIGSTVKISYWDITGFDKYDYQPQTPIEEQCAVFETQGEVIKSTSQFLVLCTEKETTIAKHVIGEHPYREVIIIPKKCIKE